MARYRFNFWLDGNKDDELIVAEKVDELKRKRSFSSVLRDGIMIVSELREGRADLLFKLYPWVADMVKPSAPVAATDTGDLERQIDELKRIILGQGSTGAVSLDSTQKPTGIPGSHAKIALPVFDDQDTIVLTKSSGNTMDNFRDSMAKLGLGF
jgi:hypothetical protein